MRIVKERIVPAGVGRLRAGEPGTNLKEYFDRVAKYIPAEVVAAYISANGVAVLSRFSGILFIVIFAVCLIATPIYITRFAETKKEKWINGSMSFIAFIVWAYATGIGLVKHLNWYDAPTASVILILFTVISGFAVPVTRQQPPQPQLIPNNPQPKAKED
jgi:uncharacterized membrane protein